MCRVVSAAKKNKGTEVENETGRCYILDRKNGDDGTTRLYKSRG